MTTPGTGCERRSRTSTTMARDVLAAPGVYVLVEPADLDADEDDDEPVGWVLLRQV